MHKKELIEKLSLRSGKTKTETADFLKNFIEVMNDTLERGEQVQVLGFGTFSVKDRPERQCHNPRTGTLMTVPACRKVSFKASPSLDGLINKK